jgi:hypothetical protein
MESLKLNALNFPSTSLINFLESIMNLEIPESSKFALIALKTYVNLGNDEILSFTNGLSVLASLPTEVDDFWVKTIGTLNAKDISESNFILFAHSDDVDITEKDLERFLFNHYFGLLIQGFGYTNQGFNLSGVSNNSLLHVNSISSEFTFKRPPKVLYEAYTINKTSLEKSILLAESINKIFQNETYLTNKNYLRLRKGFNAFIDGLRVSEVNNLYKRLPFFVKAIEAIFKPKIGRTERQFVHRCKFIGGDKKENQEIYRMRSSAEHLNPMEETLTDYSANEIIDVMCLRTYQIELLASHLYQNVLSNQELLENFQDDAKIETFWKKTDDELKIIFGKPIDFKSISERWFVNWIDGWY